MRAARAPRRSARPGDARSGSLLLKTEGEGYTDAARLGIDVDVTVSGPTLRARVSQMFYNPTDGWVEAVYVYPLPDGGAVDTLKMVVGERVVIGEIKERAQARVVYEQAKAAGQKAGLMEQERPNIFTNSVANIGPKETVVVQIEYQEPVHQSGMSSRCACRWSSRPVIIRRRSCRASTSARTVKAGARSPTRSRIARASSRLCLIRASTLRSIRSPSRFGCRPAFRWARSRATTTTSTSTRSRDVRVIKLADGVVPADRDFELTWKSKSEAAPAVGLFREHVGDADYLLAFVTPPVLPPSEEQRPREIVFVIDNSGSMGGTSIVQAKASLTYALGRLKPSDRFNVIRFDDSMTVLFPDTVSADAAHVGQAKAFVAALQASGGTEMVPPMQAALTDRRGSEAGTVRQVVFLTDGEIGNEQQLFDTISAMRGRSRLFMVGIGSAPNTFLMTRASELGRGSFTHIGSVEQVEERMKALFGKLESPAVTNLTATFSAAGADVSPVVLPDLYRGEPVALTAKVGALAGSLDVKGTIGDRPWIVTLPLSGAAEGKGLSQLWARRKITDAEVSKTLGKLSSNDADARILSLALDHHLVTRLTSLVAVDKTPSRPEGAHLTRAELPLNLPAGWEFDKVFGGEHAPVPARLPVIERRAQERDGRVQVAMRAAACASYGFGRRSTDAGRRAAGDRDRCRVEHDPRRRADGIRPDPSRASAAGGFSADAV